MGNPIQEFFDALAPSWDDHSEDKMGHIESLLSRLDIRPGSKVLDLACGTGIISGLLHDKFGAEVFGLDISPKMIEIAREKYQGKEGVRFEVGDFFDMPEDGSFDWIVCHNAFPHFLDVAAFVEQTYGCLADGGEFVVFHSLGREKLKRHHDGLAPVISRDLLPVEEEAMAFSERFDILEADESNTHFWIHGRK